MNDSCGPSLCVICCMRSRRGARSRRVDARAGEDERHRKRAAALLLVALDHLLESGVLFRDKTLRPPHRRGLGRGIGDVGQLPRFPPRRLASELRSTDRLVINVILIPSRSPGALRRRLNCLIRSAAEIGQRPFRLNYYHCDLSNAVSAARQSGAARTLLAPIRPTLYQGDQVVSIVSWASSRARAGSSAASAAAGSSITRYVDHASSVSPTDYSCQDKFICRKDPRPAGPLRNRHR